MHVKININPAEKPCSIAHYFRPGRKTSYSKISSRAIIKTRVYLMRKKVISSANIVE